MKVGKPQALEAAEPDLGFQARGLYFGGKWQAPAAGRTFVSINPSTGRQLAEIPYADAKDVDRAVKAGYVWINGSGRYLGAPYGGWKSSGLGVEENFDELLSYTQLKNIHLRW